MAADANGQVIKYSGGRWHRPVQLESTGPDEGFYSLSCPAVALCIATDGDGRIARLDGAHWSTPALINGRYRGGVLSCPSTTFCMSLGRKVAIWNGSAWSISSNPLPTRRIFQHVSCASRRFCMAMYYSNATGNVAWMWHDHVWTRSARLYQDGGNTLWDITCTSANFCMTIGDFEVAVRWDGTRWTRVGGSQSTPDEVFSVSCMSRNFCMSVGLDGANHSRSTIWNGHRWGHRQTFDYNHRAVDVSCAPGTTDCRTVDLSGRVMHFVHGGWTKPLTIDPPYGQIDTVACGAGQCVAIDATGRAMTSTGSSWSAPRRIDPYVQINFGSPPILSCAWDGFCMTLDGLRHVHRLDGAVWSAAESIPLQYPAALDCRSATWCMAMSAFGRVSIWHGAHWSAPHSSFHDSSGSGLQWSLSCATRTFCVAYNSDDAIVRRYVSGHWSAARDLGANYEASVSCVSATFCMATGSDFETWRYDGTRWHAVPIPSWQVHAISCRSAQFCVAVGSYGQELSFDGSSWTSDATFDLPYYGDFYTIDCAATFCAAANPVNVSIGARG